MLLISGLDSLTRRCHGEAPSYKRDSYMSDCNGTELPIVIKRTAQVGLVMDVASYSAAQVGLATYVASYSAAQVGLATDIAPLLTRYKLRELLLLPKTSHSRGLTLDAP